MTNNIQYLQVSGIPCMNLSSTIQLVERLVFAKSQWILRIKKISNKELDRFYITYEWYLQMYGVVLKISPLKSRTLRVNCLFSSIPIPSKLRYNIISKSREKRITSQFTFYNNEKARVKSSIKSTNPRQPV